MNQFTSPILLSGVNLYEQEYIAAAMAANANGKGDYILYGDMKLYFDLFNIDTVNDPDEKSYLISQGALALGNRALNPERPERLQDFTRYKIRSQYLPMWYDVYYDNECSSAYDLVKHNFKVKLTADVFNNPHGCTEHNTGVLSFVCGTAS